MSEPVGMRLKGRCCYELRVQLRRGAVAENAITSKARDTPDQGDGGVCVNMCLNVARIKSVDVFGAAQRLTNHNADKHYCRLLCAGRHTMRRPNDDGRPSKRAHSSTVLKHDGESDPDLPDVVLYRKAAAQLPSPSSTPSSPVWSEVQSWVQGKQR